MKNEEAVQPQAPGNPDFSLQPSAFNVSFKPLPIISSRAVKLGGTVVGGEKSKLEQVQAFCRRDIDARTLSNGQ